MDRMLFTVFFIKSSFIVAWSIAADPRKQSNKSLIYFAAEMLDDPLYWDLYLP